MYIITRIVITMTAFLISCNADDEFCCGKFEEITNCANTCTEKKCIPAGESKICPMYCKKGCVCKEGFVRISDNTDQCIPECLCPFLTPFIEEQTSCFPCGKNSRYTTCGRSCPETCNPSEYDTVRCSSDQNLVGCVCNPGFVKVSKAIDICIPKFLCSFLLPFTT
ncbi:zonadhesin-like [Agrilus planipennis]|uniref:Zonadhesin-like n=1 Tax=Agrilus planipennis TaxID=224129 RepID=A0A1W4WJP0_AGRPL|nr:zonadhesin-like [Agrilus planipennis]